MIWQSTLWEMSRRQLDSCLKKHRKKVNKLLRDFEMSDGASSPEFVMFSDLLEGYRIMEELYVKQDEVHKEKVQALEGRVKDLEKRLHLGPENSHKPPSTSRFKKIKNQRIKTGKSPGGQLGRKGVKPEIVAEPDTVVCYEPQKCRSCGKDLRKIERHEVDRRQVVDLKKGSVYITEYQRVTKYCPYCDDMNRGDIPLDSQWTKAKKTFGPNLKSIALYLMGYQLLPVARTQEVLFDLYGAKVSQGSLCNFTKKISGDLREWRLIAKSQLISSKILHTDETSVRCEGRNDWVHVLSNEQLTILEHHLSRGAIAQKEIGVLPEFKGHLVHDGFKSYEQFESCSHSFCNAHILRELKYIYEEEKQGWASDLEKLLKKTLKKVVQQKRVSFDYLKKRYRSILRSGFEQNGYLNEFRGRPPDGFKSIYEKRKWKKVPTFKRRKLSKAMNLLVRLRDHSDRVLYFAKVKNIPFTNNQAERDLRMLKVKEKISGCFRSQDMAKYFLLLRSFISTLRKQNLPLIENITALQTKNADFLSAHV